MNDPLSTDDLVSRIAALDQEERTRKTWRRLAKRVKTLASDALIVLEPDLEAIIEEILKPLVEKWPHQGHFQRIVYFIEKLTRRNLTVRGVEDRTELASALKRALREFHGRGPHSGDLMSLLFRCIDESISFFRATTYSETEHVKAIKEARVELSSMQKKWQEIMAEQKVLQTRNAQMFGMHPSTSPAIAKAWPPEFSASSRRESYVAADG